MTVRFLLPILLALTLGSCVGSSDRHRAGALAEGDIVTTDTVFTFDSEYPVEIQHSDGNIYVTLHESDSLVCVISTASKTITDRFGKAGQGPDDFSSLEFLANAATLPGKPQFLDCNSGKTFSPDSDGIYRTNRLPVSWISPLNKFGDRYVGKKVGKPDVFFSIFDNAGNELQSVPYPFSLAESTKSKISGKEYLLSPYVFANGDKGRIIAAMYYADAAFVYDSIGNLLTSISLNADKNSDIDAMLNDVVDNRPYTRYRGGCATETSCFMRLSHYIPDLELQEMRPEQSCLLEFDWDGTLLNIYNMEEDIVAFCIDRDRTMWTLKRATDNDNEYYHILRQTLNKASTL